MMKVKLKLPNIKLNGTYIDSKKLNAYVEEYVGIGTRIILGSEDVVYRLEYGKEK